MAEIDFMDTIEGSSWALGEPLASDFDSLFERDSPAQAPGDRVHSALARVLLREGLASGAVSLEESCG